MRKGKLLITATISASLLLQNTAVCISSAISVPPDARNTINEAIAESDATKEKKQNLIYKEEAEKNVLTAAEEAARAQHEAEQARMRFEQLKQGIGAAELEKDTTAQAAAEAYALAEQLTKEAEEAYARADAAYSAADRAESELQRQEQAADAYNNDTAQMQDAASSVSENNYSGIDDELLRSEYELKQREEENRRLEEARINNTPSIAVPDTSGAQNAASLAQIRAGQIGANAEAIGQRSEEAWKISEEKTALAEAAFERYENLKSELDDAELTYNDYQAYANEAQNGATQAAADRDSLFAELDNPAGSYYAATGLNLYSWNGDGVKGYQFVQPIYAGYWSENFSYGIFTYNVSSHSKTTGRTGHYTGLTDTTFLITKRQQTGGKFFFDYSFSVNIPTGKSAMNWGQRYARFDEDLVGIEQFGKGWQFTPGIAVNYKPNEKDTWTIGTSYIYSRPYDLTSDIPNDTFDPGGEWGRFLRYKHAGNKWQVVAELLNTAYGRSKLANGESYTTDANWEYRLTVNRRLSHDQDLMFYYWPERQNRNDVPFSSSNSLVHYYGTMWSKRLDPKRTLRVSLDIMQTSGARYAGLVNGYDPVTGFPFYSANEVDGRRKITFGVGYDYRINEKSNFNLDVQYFQMKDGVSTMGDPKRNYKGFNILFMYNRDL